MGIKEEQARRFLNVANNNYIKCKKQWMKYFNDKLVEFDEDVFSESILKVYDLILKNGIKDDTEEGMLNYWFMSFQMNTRREQQYSRNSQRDKNVDVFEELNQKENGDEELKLKIRNQVYDDFAVIYILEKIEGQIDPTAFYVFRLYYLLPKMTYEKLRNLTKIKNCKKLVLDTKKYVQQTITKDEILKAFNDYYDN